MDIVKGDMQILLVTSKAIQLRARGRNVWIPRSQIGKIESGLSSMYEPKVGSITSIELPRWLVEEKGL